MSSHEFPSNPWGELDVVWLDPPGNAGSREDAFKRLASEPNRTHIVREVHVLNRVIPQLKPSTQSEAEDTLTLVDEEFDKLESYGVKIARPSWHIISRSDLTEYTTFSREFLHILARVPIVDGDHPASPVDRYHLPLDEACGLMQSVGNYLNQVRVNQPYFWDVQRLAQYIFGKLRIDEPDTAKQPILIDPDILIEINYE